MRIIKLLLISAIALFGVMTALSLLFPSRLRLSRAVNVAVPREKVYAAIGDLRRWEEWNAFIRATPLTGKTFSSPASGKGAFLHTDQLVLTLMTSAPDSVALDWRLSTGKHFEGGYNILQTGSDSITVQSWFDFHFRWYPWEKFSSLLLERSYGSKMEQGLTNLKKLLQPQ